MSYQISKYDAVKAALIAEKSCSNNVSEKIQQAIQRAANYEIQKKKYSKMYIITENEKKYFEKVACHCVISAVDDNNDSVKVTLAVEG